MKSKAIADWASASRLDAWTLGLTAMQTVPTGKRNTLNIVYKTPIRHPNIHGVKRCFFLRCILVRIVFASETMKKVNQ
ncbi:hypothetical protein [Comamonas sp. C11]|uniref:hypothetical protein n=1 Tax=Comamonas sp. C11 TaxID=2966554 RepID=UPI002112C55D|nr:hypothetical protein [Comamonas sp. C11]UUC94584.1 hypothetical protein NOX35_04400 [Comamonas sp. C11]